MNNNTNFNTTNNAINTNYYQNKSTLYKVKKSPITKIKDYLVTDDFIINKNNNRNSSLYQLAITEESKKNINTFVKKNHASIKKVKTSSHLY